MAGRPIDEIRGGLARDGLLVSAERLAAAWQIELAALDGARGVRHVFGLQVGESVMYLAVLLLHTPEQVARITQACGTASDAEMFVWWHQKHGALAGKTLGEALAGGVPLWRVIALTADWAAENGHLDQARRHLADELDEEINPPSMGNGPL